MIVSCIEIILYSVFTLFPLLIRYQRRKQNVDWLVILSGLEPDGVEERHLGRFILFNYVIKIEKTL